MYHKKSMLQVNLNQTQLEMKVQLRKLIMNNKIKAILLKLFYYQTLFETWHN